MSFWDKWDKEPELTPEQREEEKRFLMKEPKRTLSGETTQIINSLAYRVEEEIQRKKEFQEKTRRITESLKECTKQLKKV